MSRLKSSWTNDFNPRSREGSDAQAYIKLGLITEISIHAPAKGAT